MGDIEAMMGEAELEVGKNGSTDMMAVEAVARCCCCSEEKKDEEKAKLLAAEA